jgi:hypothetical protein
MSRWGYRSLYPQRRAHGLPPWRRRDLLNTKIMSQRTSNLTSKPATVVVGGALINELGLMGAKMTHAQNEEI